MTSKTSKSDQVKAHPSWTRQEKWVWQKLSAGEVADFNKANGYGGKLEPKKPEGWPESRILSSKFLETILLDATYSATLTRYGVRIVGAWFKEPINFLNAILDHRLILSSSRFDSDVYLTYIKTPYLINLTGSKFYGKLNMTRTEVTLDLHMHNAEFADKVVLHGAKIGGQLSMDGSKFLGELYMEQLQVQSGLFMRNMAEFAKEVNLHNATIMETLEMDNSKFMSTLNMDNLQVYKSLFMRNGAEFAEVNLVKAKIEGSLGMNSSNFNKELTLSEATIEGSLNMKGSKFNDTLYMERTKVKGDLFMDNNAEFAKEVVLSSAKVGGTLEMVGSKFQGKINMDKIEVASSLFMRGGAEFAKEVILVGAKVGGTLDMEGSKFEGELIMDKMEVASSLFMREGAEFSKELILRGAKIGGQLSMIGSKFNGKLNMNGLEVGGSFLMGNMEKGAEFLDEVFLVGANINGQLGMSRSKFKGTLNMESIRVSESLYLIDSIAENLINMIFSDIRTNLFITGSKLENFDLTGSKIKGEFCLGSGKFPPAQWKKGAKLILRNTEVGALQDLPESWPDKIDLDGFIYKQLGGFAVEESDSFATRTLAWMKTWLKKQQVFSPQPYKQLSNILNETGHGVKAKDILYACKEQERSKSKCLYWLWRTLQKLFIGYGYRIYYLLFWVAGFTFLGAVILNLSRQGPANGMPYGIAYSLDMLLPLIRLNETHYTIQLFGFAKYYFYFQKITGYFLVSLLIYGISEIVRKPRE